MLMSYIKGTGQWSRIKPILLTDFRCKKCFIQWSISSRGWFLIHSAAYKLKLELKLKSQFLLVFFFFYKKNLVEQIRRKDDQTAPKKKKKKGERVVK